MTDLDADESSFKNSAGWDIVHGPKGNWAVAMLDVDRELAVKVGRMIVGHYADRQLQHIDDKAHAAAVDRPVEWPSFIFS